jgi:hypothetical protein
MSEAIYILGHSQAEIRRLINQAAILRSTTERLLGSAGIEHGMRVLDVECGAGDVSMLAGKLVGVSRFSRWYRSQSGHSRCSEGSASGGWISAS